MMIESISLLFFERCWPNSIHIKTQAIEHMCEGEDRVFMLYKVVTNDGKEFRNIELLTFDGDKIKGVEVYFGAAYRNGTLAKE